jgi:catalase
MICLCVQVLNAEQKKTQVENIAAHLKNAQEFLQKRAVENFGKADPEYGSMLQEALNRYKK